MLEPEESQESGVRGRESGAPPVGACSEDDGVAEESPAQSEKENDANTSVRRLSELLRTSPQEALAGLSRPARSLFSAGDGNVITQLRLTPDKPGASIEHMLSPPQRELTRQERRRLQKKLKRAKGLA